MIRPRIIRNKDDARAIANLFLGAGAEGGTVRQIADEIVDLRAIPPCFAEEQIGRLPRMTPDLLPAVTVHGGSRIVDPATSSRLVLAALAGGDMAMVERYIATRQRDDRLALLSAADAGPVIGSGFEIEAKKPRCLSPISERFIGLPR